MGGANTKGITATFINEGGIWYQEVTTDSHNFEIHMYENKVGSLDVFGINTTTPDEREWVARDAFSFIPEWNKTKEYPTCQSPIKVLGEKSYQVTNHPKKWLNTTWWVLYVQCDKVNPHYIR
ncbi:hypothetical protein [Amphritea japonica]|nr:hypothetical protein [Amphritea japonica]